MMRTKYGGFDKAGVTSVDCKNFKNQLNLFVGEYDVDMVVNMLLKKEFSQDFSFEYTMDNKNQLNGLFWADGHSKANYIVFVTGQDAAIKQAVEAVWLSSRHRLCMWHIMTKASDSFLSVCKSQSGDYTRFDIKDLKAKGKDIAVLYCQEDGNVTVMCSCKSFEQYGLLCRHCFYFLRLCDIKVICST
ncbi:hypothetical protein R6Q59_012674 [Mikania micrantha]